MNWILHFYSGIESEKSTLTAADYDFSGVKSDELQACDLYEYARESCALRLKAAEIRELFKKAQGKSVMVWGLGNSLQQNFLIALSYMSGFPKIAWQCLGGTDKKRIFNFFRELPNLSDYLKYWNNPPMTLDTHSPEAMTLEAWKKQYRQRTPDVSPTDPIKSGFFAINFRYSHPDLVKAFAKWLWILEGKPMSQYVPIKEETHPKPVGRHSYRDPLNALGALRLRYHYATFLEAQKIVKNLSQKPDGMSYRHRVSFNRACGYAIRRFQVQFGWIDCGQPIHFSTGWKKGMQK